MGGRDPSIVIEPVVVDRGEGYRAVVDVQQDDIERRPSRPQKEGDIHLLASDSLIPEWITGVLADGSPVPLDHSRHQFGHHDLGVGSELAQCRGQREANTQPADQHPGPYS